MELNITALNFSLLKLAKINMAPKFAYCPNSAHSLNVNQIKITLYSSKSINKANVEAHRSKLLDQHPKAGIFLATAKIYDIFLNFKNAKNNGLRMAGLMA